VPEFGGYPVISALDGAGDKFLIYDASGATPEDQTRTVTPNALVAFLSLVTSSALTTALSAYVTAVSLATTLTGYFAKRADGGITAASTDTEHIFTLNHAPDAIEKTNVVRVTNLALTGASAVRGTDQAGRETWAVGSVNGSADGVFDANSAFQGNAYLEASNLDPTFLEYQAPGWTAVQTGGFRGFYATRVRQWFERLTQDLSWLVPSPSSGLVYGTPALAMDNRGNVNAGLASLDAGAGNGFFGFPLVSGDPTGAPLYHAGYAKGCYNKTNHTFWVWEADPDLSLPTPTIYFTLGEATGTAPGDEVYGGPGRLTAAGPGTIAAVVSGPQGSGTAKRLDRSTGDQRYLQVSPGPDGTLTEDFFLSLWVRPQTAFGYSIGRIWVKESVLQVAINSSGQVHAEHNQGQTIPASAATQLTLNVWSHIKVWRIGGATKRLFLQVDSGAVQQSATYTGTPLLSNSQPLGVGGYPDGFNQNFGGDMAGFGLFLDTSLTESQRDSITGSPGRVFAWSGGWTEGAVPSGTWASATLTPA
jgi:hypothetical protein